MNTFRRADGVSLTVIPGFRSLVLGYRAAVTPRADWSEDDFAISAAKKCRRAQRMIRKLERWSGPLAGQRVLDVGCGDGANSLVIAQQPVREMTGIDLELKLQLDDAVGERTRRLAATILGCQDVAQLPSLLRRLPLSFRQMDATRLEFPDGMFDILFTRSAMENIRPVEVALSEMLRVLRAGGLLHLVIDPFYWVRGCHKRGVVDIPWAHARLTLPDFRRFVQATEGAEAAVRRVDRIETLNRFTVAQWKELITTQAAELLAWEETPSELGAELLEHHPEVGQTLLPGIMRLDLICERIEVWLRRK